MQLIDWTSYLGSRIPLHEQIDHGKKGQEALDRLDPDARSVSQTRRPASGSVIS